MDNKKLLDYLFTKRHTDRRSNLNSVISVFNKLNSPSNGYPTIHVAGTNGKGSVCLKIAAVLQAAGWKVGLYTSPHLISFYERIMINQICIQPLEVERYLLDLFRLDPNLNFFEYTTLMALQYFADQKVDIAVIETGLGGLLDPTNIITPTLSIITSISKDHEAILGGSLEEIAFQKAGIIKPKIPVVLGPRADFLTIRKQAEICQSPLYLVTTHQPFYDDENNAIAKQGLDIIAKKFKLDSIHIQKGLSIRPACRFEQRGNLILDVAHNPDAMERLLQAYQLHFSSDPFTVIIGMSVDKDIESSLKILTKKADHLYLVESKNYRSVNKYQMGAILEKLSFFHFSYPLSIAHALKEALSTQGRVLVCGSFYIMEEVKKGICAM